MSRDHPASGQEPQERPGERRAERKGSGMGERGEQSDESLVTNS
jgi:hypothetical protein